MLTSALPASLKNKYPQFKVGSVEQQPSNMEVNLNHQRKTQEIKEHLEKNSPLWPLMGENLVTLTRFDRTLALNLMFLDLHNINEREKQHALLVMHFDKFFSTKPSDIMARDTVREELHDDTQGRYGKIYPKGTGDEGVSVHIAGKLELKSGKRYYVRDSLEPNLFQYLLNRDQHTYSNLPVSDWNYERSAMKPLYVCVFRALRETKWK